MARAKEGLLREAPGADMRFYYCIAVDFSAEFEWGIFESEVSRDRTGRFFKLPSSFRAINLVHSRGSGCSFGSNVSLLNRRIASEEDLQDSIKEKGPQKNVRSPSSFYEISCCLIRCQHND